MYEIAVPVLYPNRRFIVDAASFGLAVAKLCEHLSKSQPYQLTGQACKLIKVYAKATTGIYSATL